MGTGWFAADAANVGPGSRVAVVGDGAVGLLAVLSARQKGAERLIAMSRHEPRQRLALAMLQAINSARVGRYVGSSACRTGSNSMARSSSPDTST
jgi:threonine dehydrogenase-like Zn-dependent dehydrogenase